MKKEQLLEMMRSARVPHALLIAGPAGSGCKTLARRAASIWCIGRDDPAALISCANYHEIADASIGVDAVRALISQSAVQGFNGGNSAFAILDAHRMTAQAQNALLKTLEEPPSGTILILTGNEAGLLPTIRSRAAIFRLGASEPKAVAAALTQEGMDAELALAAAQLADGVPGRAREMASAPYQALREAANACLREALFGNIPFPAMQGLLAMERQTEGSKGERKRPDLENASDTVLLWQLVLRDALLKKTGGAPLSTASTGTCAGEIAGRFTISQIQGMIKITVDTEKQLRLNANPAQAMDTALVRLSDKERTTW